MQSMACEDLPLLKIRYHRSAVRQLDKIFTDITLVNPRAAHRVNQAVKRSIERLASFPYSTRASEVPGIRELPVVRYPYNVFYSVDEAAREVHILRVRHTSRDPRRHLD
jgi:toxin ParE1/3/4